MESHVDCIVHCLHYRQTEEYPARVQWCPSGGPAPVFQMTSWPQTLEPQAFSRVVLLFFISFGWGWWWIVWSIEGDFVQFQWSVEDLCEDGGQLVSTGFQTDWFNTVWAGAFFLFCFWKTWHTSSSLIWIAGVGERGVARGVNGCVERCSEQVWGVFFKPAIELIQIV